MSVTTEVRWVVMGYNRTRVIVIKYSEDMETDQAFQQLPAVPGHH